MKCFTERMSRCAAETVYCLYGLTSLLVGDMTALSQLERQAALKSQIWFETGSKCFPQKAHWLTFTNGQGWTRRNWPHWSFRADTNLHDWNLKRGSESLLYLLNLTMWLKWVISNLFQMCETKSAWKRVISKLPYPTLILQSPIWIL